MESTFDEIQREAIAFRDARDWKQFHRLKDLVLGLGIEAGELAELFLWKREDEARAALSDPAFARRLADEMADVQIFLLYLAEDTGVSLPEAVRRKLLANAAKYPIEKARGSARKYTELT
ncbi:MAG: nucleotide pyrophosphohydrolase [Planctomycetota bacterium]